VALASGALHAVEAVGLALRLRAVVYLTIVATIAVIPVELWWLSNHPGRIREIVLAVDVAVVVTLCGTVVQAGLRARRARREAALPAARVPI
jgi:uncharacterized membrane protein (DUF2068 family)